MGFSPDDVPKSTAKTTLQRFKRQNHILKKFGKDGLKVLRTIDGKKSWKEIQEETGLDESFIEEIATWMKRNKYIEILPQINEEEEKKEIEEKDVGEEKVEDTEKIIEPEEIEGGGMGDAGAIMEISPISPEIQPSTKIDQEEKFRIEATEEAEEGGMVQPVEEDVGEVFGQEEEPEELSPEEKILKEKFGDVGVKVYRLIDGQRSAQEILEEVGISEDELINMLEYMERHGIIKLEHEVEREKESKEGEGILSPLIGEKPIRKGVIIESDPVEIPTKKKTGLFNEITIKMKLLVNFGRDGLKVWNTIDGKKSDVDIMVSTRIPLYSVKDILSFLYENNVIDLHTMSRQEILKRYGDEAYAIYKRFGSTGVGLYEIIDYDLPLKEMARLTTPDKEKFVQIFSFIHHILGVDIPLDREIILNQI
jgi:DNA-binding Lrp family transcriptional regulator